MVNNSYYKELFMSLFRGAKQITKKDIYEYCANFLELWILDKEFNESKDFANIAEIYNLGVEVLTEDKEVVDFINLAKSKGFYGN